MGYGWHEDGCRTPWTTCHSSQQRHLNRFLYCHLPQLNTSVYRSRRRTGAAETATATLFVPRPRRCVTQGTTAEVGTPLAASVPPVSTKAVRARRAVLAVRPATTRPPPQLAAVPARQAGISLTVGPTVAQYVPRAHMRAAHEQSRALDAPLAAAAQRAMHSGRRRPGSQNPATTKVVTTPYQTAAWNRPYAR
jgi:hypothetical protein